MLEKSGIVAGHSHRGWQVARAGVSYKKAVISVYFTAAMAPAVAVWVWRPCAVLVAHFSAVRPYLGSLELISLISVDGDTHALFMAPAPSMAEY